MRTPCRRAIATTSSCNAMFPVSPNPDGMRIAPATPLAPASSSAFGTNCAGIAKMATSTSPGTSAMLRNALRSRISLAFGLTG